MYYFGCSGKGQTLRPVPLCRVSEGRSDTTEGEYKEQGFLYRDMALYDRLLLNYKSIVVKRF